MANKIKGEVSLQGADGETYTLVFGFEQLVLVEDKRRKSFSEVVEELNDGRLGSLGALFWAGVCQHNPDLSYEEAGRIVMAIAGEGRGEELQAKIVEAITLAFPRKKEADQSTSGPPKEVAAST